MTPIAQMFRRATNLLHDSGARFAHDLAAIAAGQLLSKVIGFVAFAYIARAVAPAAYGQVEFVVGVAAFLTLVIQFGLGSIGVRRVARDPGDVERIAAGVTALQLLLAVLSAPLLLVITSAVGYPPETLTLAALFALSLLLLGLSREWLLQARDFMFRVALAQVLRAAVFTLIVVLFVSGSQRAFIIGVAELISVATFVAFHLWTQHTRIAPLRVDFNPARLVDLFREASSVGAANLLWALQQYAPLILLAPIVGPLQFAWFAAAQRIVLSLLTFSNSYHFSLYPTLSRLYIRDKALHLATVGAALRATSAIALAAALAIALLADPIVTIVFGAQFADAGPLLAILVWTIPLAVIGGHARWTLVTAQKPQYVLYSQLTGVIAGLISGVILVPIAGVLGGAMAVSLMAASVTIAAHASASRVLDGFPSIHYSALLLGCAVAIASVADGLAAPVLLETIAGLALFALCAVALNRNLNTDILRLIYARKGEPGAATPD